MPSASDSAYPRLKANPSATELGEIYTPSIFELVFAAESTRRRFYRQISAADALARALTFDMANWWLVHTNRNNPQ